MHRSRLLSILSAAALTLAASFALADDAKAKFELGARPETPAAPVTSRSPVDARSIHHARTGRLPHLSGSMLLRQGLRPSSTTAGPPGRVRHPRGSLAAPLGPDTRDYDQIDLVVDLDIDIEAGAIKGFAQHRLKSLVEGLEVVHMHLEDMEVEGVFPGEMGGEELPAEVKDGILTITLGKPVAKGEEFVLTIHYGGKPKSGLWFFHPTEANPDIPLQVWSQGEGEENRHWIPCYDLPDDRLTTTIAVSVPKGLQVLSNGYPQPAPEMLNGKQAHIWKLDRPHPTYLITLVIGKFDVAERDAAGVKQYDYVAPGWGKWCDEIFGRTPSMMGFFQDATGEPYAWGRYSHVTVWDFSWGGMENTGATTLNMRALHKDGVRPDYTCDGLLAHELAHDWFGDLITCRTFNHMWLNEGYATYFTDLWVEYHHGVDEFRAARLRSKNAYMKGADLAKLARRALPENPTDCADMRQHPYVKGSAALHMLRGLMGDEKFHEALRAYVRDNRDKSIDSEAMRASFERVHGDDLGWFFDQWVYRSGYPELAVSSEWDKDAGALVMTVDQTQPVTSTMPLFRTPVDVEVMWPDGTVERRRHQLHSASHTWRILGPGKPKLVRFDPEDWLLADVTVKQSLKAWQTQLTDDPLSIGRILAARAMGGKGVKAIPALAAAGREDSRFEVRAECAKALGKIGGRAAGIALQAMVEDAESRVRTAVLEAMGSIPAPWSAATLKKHLAEDKSQYAAAAAAAALGKTRAPGALEALEAALARDSHRDTIRMRVMEGLESLADPRGAAPAMRYLGYEFGRGIQHRLRHAALDAVVALAPTEPSTRGAVVDLLGDPYFRMRQWAAGHAAALGIEEALPALEDMARNGIGPGVQGAAKRALAKLRAEPWKEEEKGEAKKDAE